jgi:hypothetical protein
VDQPAAGAVRALLELVAERVPEEVGEVDRLLASQSSSARSSPGITNGLGRLLMARGRMVWTISNARGITSSDPHSFWASRHLTSLSGGEAVRRSLVRVLLAAKWRYSSSHLSRYDLR